LFNLASILEQRNQGGQYPTASLLIDTTRSVRTAIMNTAPTTVFSPPASQADRVQELVRLIAFYLPQFHPIPENDRWWGKGFTEWTNVTKTKPQFRGHEQPHLPSDLGFYDLRLPEARQAQAELAAEYGIHGFCYYHYWFTGNRLLERPFNDVLASAEPDFPFCLCWANEPWTRRWDGSENEVIFPQVYSAEDDRAHLQWLAKAFADPRYIRVEDKPLFLVYRSSKLPEPLRTTDIWRNEARKLGIGDLYLCRVNCFESEMAGPPEATGFDAAVEFMPEWHNLGPRLQMGRKWNWARRLRLADEGYVRHRVHSYEHTIAAAKAKKLPDHRLYRCVTPGWDNSARRAVGAHILQGSNPDLYRDWLAATVAQTRQNPPEHQIVFINAWNEWAEGNHLEPCRRWGRAYLEATKAGVVLGR
jgi:lipopolysaccharide biosynthesis protein